MLKLNHYAGKECTIMIYECDKCGQIVKVHEKEWAPEICPYCWQSSTEVTSVPSTNNDQAS